MKKFASLIAACLSLFTFSGSAGAATATCISFQDSIALGFCTGTCLSSVQQNHPECFGSASSTASATQEILSTSFRQMLVVSQIIGMRNTALTRPIKTADSGQRIGVAGGDSGSQWNVWGNLGEDKNKYDRGGFVDAGVLHNNIANNNITNAVVGGDYQLNPATALGISAAFDSGSGSYESFTAGVSNGATSQSTSGYTIAPYLGWQINQDWSLDASLGFGRVKLNSSEASGKADRLFYGANLGYTNWLGNWQLMGKGSYLHGEEKYGDLTSSIGLLLPGTSTTNKLDQLRVGGQAGYWMNDSMMPYASLNYSTDLSRSTSASPAGQFGTDIGKTAWIGSIGANFFSLKNSITGSLFYTHEFSRTYSKVNSLMGNINFRF